MPKASLVLYSNAIFNSIQDTPYAGGVAIEDNKIVFAGSKDQVATYVGPNTIVKDVGDSMIMPGFFDAHGHFQTAAIWYYGPCISGLELCRSQEEVIEGVRQYLKENPDCKRVHGRCWMLCSWGVDAGQPTKESLDAAFPDIPVYLISSNGHVSWINSAAIRECDLEGIVKAHPAWPAEFAPRDEKGEFTGFVTENVSYTVRYMVEVYTREEYAQCDRKMLDLLCSLGVTSFTDTTLLSGTAITDYYEPMKLLENENKLHVRFHHWGGNNVMGNATDGSVEAGLQSLKTLQSYFNGDKLRIVGNKILVDGVPDSHTGAMFDPYPDCPSTRGELIATPEAYKRCITLANSMGLPVQCHCMGNRSVHVILDAFEESRNQNGDQGLRNGIQHMNIVMDDDIKRMSDMGIIASVQPAHLMDWFNGCGIKFYGPELSKLDSRYRTLINAGIHLAVGTDTPVVQVDPLRTVYEAVTRKNDKGEAKPPYIPEQAMTLAEALKGYTIEAAYSNHIDDKLGTIEPGKLADLCIIDKNLFDIPADDILHCKNICTVFDGKIVYEA